MDIIWMIKELSLRLIKINADIEYYYKTAPDSTDNSVLIYDYIYKNVVYPCVDAIKQKNYEFAYNRYKNSVLILE